MQKYYIVYTKSLAYELREKGFRIVQTGINKNHPQYDTYTFKNSEALQTAIHDIMEARKASRTKINSTIE